MSTRDVRAVSLEDLPKKAFPKVQHGFRVVLGEEAFDRAVARGEADLTREIGGVLVGEVLRDDGGPYLRIDSTIDALHAEEKGAELTFTHATWDHIHKEMDTSHKDKKVVGWYHTHPGFGVFLSDRDKFIHQSFFNLPFQIALVYDPKRREHGVFVWHEGQALRARRYWVGTHEYVWDGNREVASAGAEKETKATRERPAEENEGTSSSGEGGPTDWWTVVVVGLVVLVLAGAGGWFLGTRSAGSAIQHAQMEAIQARAEGAQQALGMLNGDLLSLLRRTLDGNEVDKRLDRALGDLDAARTKLGTPPPTDPRFVDALGRVTKARQEIVELRENRKAASSLLSQLEESAQRGETSLMAREVGVQRAALGQLYAEVAAEVARTGDKKRAARLLVTAINVDPGKRAQYERQLAEIDPRARVVPGPMPKPTTKPDPKPDLVPGVDGGTP